jgi:glycopeptide antibiotics resistance protein
MAVEPDRTRPTSARTGSRTRLLLAALGYAAFVVYGSLVPLDFRPMPLAAAWQEYRAIPFLRLGMGSRADWVANLLLFIPLGFLLMGLVDRRRSALRGLGAAAVVALCVAASAAIEFVQLFFPPRTVSQNDILAEGIGALVGVGLWLGFGPALMRWLERGRAVRGTGALAHRLLWFYLAGLVLYNVLPLDLTISPAEIHEKWKSGRVSLVPFAALPRGTAELLYELGTDVALWVPVALLLVVSGRRRPLGAWAWTLAAALGLEIAQFFVHSRVTDSTDILTAAAGGGLGAVLGGRLLGRPGRAVPGGRVPPWGWLGGALLGWSLVVAALFWYPFDFLGDAARAKTRLELFWRVPFHSYYYGTEFRAVTEVLHKVLFFAPLGVLLALGRRRLPRGLPPGVYALAAGAVIVGLPLVVELGQVLLPGKLPDSTDLLLETSGGLLGYLGTRWWLARSRATLMARPSVRGQGSLRH